MQRYGGRIVRLAGVCYRLFVRMPASLWGAARSGSWHRTRIVVTALLAVLINLAPYSLWRSIDRFVLVTRSESLFTDCSR